MHEARHAFYVYDAEWKRGKQDSLWRFCVFEGRDQTHGTVGEWLAGTSREPDDLREAIPRSPGDGALVLRLVQPWWWGTSRRAPMICAVAFLRERPFREPPDPRFEAFGDLRASDRKPAHIASSQSKTLTASTRFSGL
jgi:hypothetical protein